jgi:hypothetical protein
MKQSFPVTKKPWLCHLAKTPSFLPIIDLLQYVGLQSVPSNLPAQPLFSADATHALKHRMQRCKQQIANVCSIVGRCPVTEKYPPHIVPSVVPYVMV